MKVISIIQARVASTRLANKVLFDLEGKTVLEHVLDRVRRSKSIHDVIVATTVEKRDLAIVKLCAAGGVSVFCGSESDVLDRYYQAARLVKPEHIARITSDCPLIDPAIIDKVVERHLAGESDYTSNAIKETYPDGEDVEVFTFRALEKAWKEARLSSEREHVSPYIRKRTDIFKTVNVECEKDLSDKRWTLDNREDYEFIKEIYKNLYRKNPLFGMKEILGFLEKNPHLEKINKHIARNEGYQKSLKNDKILNPDYIRKD